jgi:predicted porin
MKKSALALAVAAGLVGFGSAAYADTTLYGSARVSVDYDEWNSDYISVDGQLVRIRGGSDAWDVYNNASRLGVRGEEDLGGGLAAIYQYEFGVDVTEGGNLNSNRPKWVGLRGNSWGSVTAGTQWTPYYNVVGIGDIFNSSKVFDNRTYLGNTFGLRMDNSLIYSSPNWSGFGFQAMLVMNGSCPPSDANTTADLCKQAGAADNKLPSNLNDGIDMYNIGVSYKNGPFFAGAAYMALEGPSLDDVVSGLVVPTIPTWDGDQWAVAFGYNSGPFAVTLAYEKGSVNTLYRGDGENVYLTGQYTFGNNVIRGSYGYTSADEGQYDGIVDGTLVQLTQSDVNNWALGYQYNFSKRTRLWVEYIGQDVDSELVGDRQAVSIGTRHDF